MSEAPTRLPGRLLRSPLGVVALFVLLGLSPLALLSFSVTRIADNVIKEHARASLLESTEVTSLFIREQLRGLGEVDASFASRPLLVRTLSDPSHHDRAYIRLTLQQLVRVRPGIATAFLADPSGRLIDIVPFTPSIIGKDFSFRDWYRGSSRTDAPYVSEAYVSQARGHPRVVAIAAPVRSISGDGSKGPRRGVLVVAYAIDTIQDFARTFALTRGTVLRITDQRGVLVAGPSLVGGQLTSVRRDPRVAEALRGHSGVLELNQAGTDVVSAYTRVAGLGWTIVEEQPTSDAFAAAERLRRVVVLVSALVLLAIAVGAGILYRIARQRQRAEDARAVELWRAQRQASINQAVLDGTTDGIMMIDPDGTIAAINTRMIEISDEHSLGMRVGEPYGEVSSRAAPHPSNAGEYLAAGQAEVGDNETIVEVTFEETGQTLVRHARPVRDAGGEVLGRIVTARDVTAERQAERLKSDLVATVSHELRTPLAGVMGFAELLVNQELDAATRSRYLETIYGEARRLNAMVNDFLDLQRIEAGRFELVAERFDLRPVLEREVELYSAQSVLHAIELEAPEGPLAVIGDRARIVQVLGNLCSNAVKYSPAGGTVRVGVSERDGFVAVAVTDDGLGIPVEQRSQIFQKFFRVDSSDTREIGGTGLGLALSREIVEAHGGRIGFDSVEGQGSTFWFELPAAVRGAGQGRPRVLVVEDEPPAMALLSEHLVSDGWEVAAAVDADSAFALAREDPPGLVCVDIALPGGADGWELIERLRAEPATAGVPIIVVTASEGGAERARSLGVAAFLTKPFAARDLHVALTAIAAG